MFASFTSTFTGSKRGLKKQVQKEKLFLADYLTAFCDSGATSFLLTSKQVKRLKKSVGSNAYKLSGPHRLWFTVSVEEGLLRWASQAYSEREESRVATAGTLIVEQPNSMSIRLENIIEIKKGSPSSLVLPPSPRGRRSPKNSSNDRYGDPWSRKNSKKTEDEALLPQHIFTIKSRDDKYMVLQAPNARKLNTWIDTLRQYIFEFGSPLGLGRDLGQGFMDVNNHYNNHSNANHYHPDQSSLTSNNNNQVMVLGRGKMSARKNRRRFFNYIQENNIDAILQMLHNNSKELLNVTDSNSNSAVIIAARSGHAPVLRALLKYGANINVKNKEGISPLLMATKAGNLDCVETLLQVNEIVSNTTQRDIELLNDNGKSLLHFAVSHNQVEIVAMLCEFAIDLLDWTDKHGNTPLHVAAKYGKYDCMKILLETAADPNILNRRGKTPLSLARSRSQRHCVKLLKDYGGSTRGHMPNENNGQKKEMDMDRIMQIWGAFLENAAKAFLTNDDQQIQQRATLTNSPYSNNDRWAMKTTPEISILKDESEYTSSNGHNNEKSSRHHTVKKPTQIYNSSSHRKVEKRWGNSSSSSNGTHQNHKWAGTAKHKKKNDAIKVWEIMTDGETGESYYWCPATNETKWTLDPGDFDMGYGHNSSQRASQHNHVNSSSINNFMSPRSSGGSNNDINSNHDEWSLNFDDVFQKYYWWNRNTSESVWDESDNNNNYNAGQEVLTATIINNNNSVNTSSATVNKDEVWTYHFDEATQRYYWWNSNTGESSWADNNADDNVDTSCNTGASGIVHDVTPVLVEEEWQECYDENGSLYYYNNFTGESQWPNTENLNVVNNHANAYTGETYMSSSLSSSNVVTSSTAVVIADGEVSDDNVWAYYTDGLSGRAYWYNAVTSESVWAD
jgi:ankyrin repeat protein